MPEYLKSYIVHTFSCASCDNIYIGKTDQNFSNWVQEHSGSDKNSPVYNCLLEYEHFNYIVNLHCLQPSNASVQYLANFKFVVYVSTKIKEQNLIQESSYFRGKNSTCIELILENQKRLFWRLELLLWVYRISMPSLLVFWN